jgi:hypothetical protein
MRRTCAFDAKGVKKFTFLGKFLHPVVVKICDENIAAWNCLYPASSWGGASPGKNSDRLW